MSEQQRALVWPRADSLPLSNSTKGGWKAGGQAWDPLQVGSRSLWYSAVYFSSPLVPTGPQYSLKHPVHFWCTAPSTLASLCSQLWKVSVSQQADDPRNHPHFTLNHQITVNQNQLRHVRQKNNCKPH